MCSKRKKKERERERIRHLFYHFLIIRDKYHTSLTYLYFIIYEKNLGIVFILKDAITFKFQFAPLKFDTIY